MSRRPCTTIRELDALPRGIGATSTSEPPAGEHVWELVWPCNRATLDPKGVAELMGVSPACIASWRHHGTRVGSELVKLRALACPLGKPLLEWPGDCGAGSHG